MEFKDVAHLYLGCDVLHQNVSDASPLRMIQISEDGWIKVRGAFTQPVIHLKSVKPILRPLSDMTEEEAKEIGKETGSGFWSIWHDAVLFKEGWDISFSALQFSALIKRGFDLFGLLESNQAIDKTTLK